MPILDLKFNYYGSLSNHHRLVGPCSLCRPSCSPQILGASPPPATTTLMWTKFSNALKPRQDDIESGSTLQGQHHPNASTRSLVSRSESPFSIPSPPGSPSKHGRRSMFKRMSKLPKGEDGAATSSPFNLPIGLPKRVKSHLHLNGNSMSCFISMDIC